MPRNRCFVEKDASGNIIRIFRTPGAAAASKGIVVEWPRKDAVEAIRRQVFKRSGNECEYCGGPVTWKFHMHEKIPRGERGEISLENCVALCSDCHLNGEHGNRKPRFGE